MKNKDPPPRVCRAPDGYDLSGTEAKKIIIKAIEYRQQIKTPCDRAAAPERRPYFTLDFE